MAVRLGCRVSPELMGRKKRGSAKFRSRKVCGFSLRHEPALVRFTGECARIVGQSENTLACGLRRIYSRFSLQVLPVRRFWSY
jgi:hypothetical protein